MSPQLRRDCLPILVKASRTSADRKKIVLLWWLRFFLYLVSVRAVNRLDALLATLVLQLKLWRRDPQHFQMHPHDTDGAIASRINAGFGALLFGHQTVFIQLAEERSFFGTILNFFNNIGRFQLLYKYIYLDSFKGVIIRTQSRASNLFPWTFCPAWEAGLHFLVDRFPQMKTWRLSTQSCSRRSTFRQRLLFTTLH